MTPEELMDRMSKSLAVEELLDILEDSGEGKMAEALEAFLLDYAESEIMIGEAELAMLRLLNE